MGLRGSLKDMSVADIIQVNCQDRKTASATLISNGKEAVIYFKDGAVVHAYTDNSSGEEAIYKILSWDDGEFALEVGAQTSEVTIKRNWSGLLLEGAKRLDESSLDDNPISIITDAELSEKSEKLKLILSQFASAIKCVEIAAVTGIDGNIKAGQYKTNVEESILGGISTAALNFGKRVLTLLKMDTYMYSTIKGESNTLFIMALTKNSILIVVTDNSTEVKMEQLEKLSQAITPFL